MRKALFVVGVISLILGIFIGTLEISSVISSKSSLGNITNILERKSGTTYTSTKAGNNYPCKIEVAYVNSQEQQVQGMTQYEVHPCWKGFNDPYTVGDHVNIVYDVNDSTNIRMNNVFDRFGFTIAFSAFGIGLIYFSKHKNKF